MKMTAKTRAIDKVFKRRDRYQIPSWQRGKVWTKPKQQMLIDTILRGWKIPKFTFIQSDQEGTEYEVADGQQRLNAIFEFMSGNLELAPSSQLVFKSKKYGDLNSELADAFDDFEIEFDGIEDETDAEIKDYFQRLQEGMSLNGSEKLNSVNSNLRDFCKNITSHKFFLQSVVFKDTRYAFFEVISKAAAIEVEGFGVGLRVDDLKRVFEGQANFSSSSEVAKRITRSLDYLSKALPNRSSVTRNKSTTQSLINLACRIVEHVDSPSSHASFSDFSIKFASELADQVELGLDATDDDYIAYQRTVNANVRSGPLSRHRILLRKLFQFDPTFSDSFNDAQIAESNLEASIKDASKDLRALIVDLNEAHSANTGHDLFRITTRVMKTLNSTSEASKDATRFSELLSGLYFVFKESIGKKLDKLPQSFQDVNDMRIGIQHDLDQEGPSAASKKKLKHGAVFVKYIGVSSPTVASGSRFAIGQLKLMNALRDDLISLIEDES